MKTITMQYPITISLDEGENVSKAYAFDVPGATVEYGSNGTAIKKMKATVSGLVTEAIKFSGREHRQRRLIVTNEGTILLVMFDNGYFGYFQATSARNYAGSTWGQDTYEEALDRARQHAESSYDGIAWECAV